MRTRREFIKTGAVIGASLLLPPIPQRLLAPVRDPKNPVWAIYELLLDTVGEDRINIKSFQEMADYLDEEVEYATFRSEPGGSHGLSV